MDMYATMHDLLARVTKLEEKVAAMGTLTLTVAESDTCALQAPPKKERKVRA